MLSAARLPQVGAEACISLQASWEQVNSSNCPNHVWRTKSSIKKWIIVRRTVRSMFGEQTFTQLRTGLSLKWTTQITDSWAHLGWMICEVPNNVTVCKIPKNPDHSFMGTPGVNGMICKISNYLTICKNTKQPRSRINQWDLTQHAH